MTQYQLLAAWVGLLGGASGFISLFLHWRLIYTQSPRVSIICTFAVVPNTGNQFYSLEIVNRGGMATTLSNVGVSFSNGLHSTFALYPIEARIGTDFPFRLDSHSSKTWLLSKASTIEAIREQNVKPYFHGYVTLATGKRFQTRKISILD